MKERSEIDFVVDGCLGGFEEAGVGGFGTGGWVRLAVLGKNKGGGTSKRRMYST